MGWKSHFFPPPVGEFYYFSQPPWEITIFHHQLGNIIFFIFPNHLRCNLNMLVWKSCICFFGLFMFENTFAQDFVSNK